MVLSWINLRKMVQTEHAKMRELKRRATDMVNLPKRAMGTWLILLIFIVLFACKEEVAPPIERIRAIKAITVTERAAVINRNFPGAVEAVDKSSLSFEISGNGKLNLQLEPHQILD